MEDLVNSEKRFRTTVRKWINSRINPASKYLGAALTYFEDDFKCHFRDGTKIYGPFALRSLEIARIEIPEELRNQGWFGEFTAELLNYRHFDVLFVECATDRFGKALLRYHWRWDPYFHNSFFMFTKALTNKPTPQLRINELRYNFLFNESHSPYGPPPIYIQEIIKQMRC